MSDNLVQNVAIHAEKDVEAGLVRIYADVFGQLVPIAAEKLGLLGTHDPSPTDDGESPSPSKASRSRKS